MGQNIPRGWFNENEFTHSSRTVLNSTFNAFICHVVWFSKSREKLLRNIFGIKYKILLSIKSNIRKIQFLELSTLRKDHSKVQRTRFSKLSTEKKKKYIFENFYGPKERRINRRSQSIFFRPTCRLSCVQSFDRVIPHWKRGPGPSRIFPARPVIIPSNTRRQPRA